MCQSTSLKISEKGERERIHGLPKFFGYPQLSQERVKIWPEHSQGPSEQKPIKNLGEKGAWAYAATAQFLARDSIYAIARYMPSPVRLSVRLSVCHTGGSVKDG